MSYQNVVKIVVRAAAGLVLAMVVTACASTRMTASWHDPNFHGPLKKIAVFVIYDDQTLRRVAEDEAVNRMPPGTQAVASYTLFDNPKKGDRERIRAQLAEQGFDGTLVTRLVGTKKDETYIPPQTYFIPGDPRYRSVPFYDSFDNYYGFAYGQVYVTPGYLREDTIVNLESILYALPGGKPVWSATSESVNPTSPKAVTEELAKLIAKDLVGHGIVDSTP